MKAILENSRKFEKGMGSVEDIFRYIIPERKEKNISKEFSKLERLTERLSRKIGEDVIIRKEIKKGNLEELSLLEELKIEEKAKVSYELFIPVSDLGYDKVDMKYIVRKEKEAFELDLRSDKEGVSLKVEKKADNEIPYSILFSYDSVKGGYKVKYEAGYKEKVENARQDFTNRLDKALEILPKSLMGGILGFTYLGSGKMARRDDLFGDMALLVDVHEAIHTADEYETRVLTDWILKRENPKYKI